MKYQFHYLKLINTCAKYIETLFASTYILIKQSQGADCSATATAVNQV